MRLRRSHPKNLALDLYLLEGRVSRALYLSLCLQCPALVSCFSWGHYKEEVCASYHVRWYLGSSSENKISGDAGDQQGRVLETDQGLTARQYCENVGYRGRLETGQKPRSVLKVLEDVARSRNPGRSSEWDSFTPQAVEYPHRVRDLPCVRAQAPENRFLMV